MSEHRWRRQRRIRALRLALAGELGRLGEHEVAYARCPGNAGDAVINAGAIAALHDARLRWQHVEPGAADVAGRTVLVAGNGNLVPIYDHVRATLFELLRQEPRQLVVLPSTVRGNDDLLARLRPTDVVMCRERVSFDHVRVRTPARTVLAHDMAFHLDARAMLADRSLATRAAPFLAERLAEHGWTLEQMTRRQTMHFMRIDGEATGSGPASDIDISHHLIHDGVWGVSPVAAWSVLRCVQASREIVTDRLHVAVAAALLGTPVELHANNYDKNAAIYDFSLSAFPDVTYRGSDART